MRKSVKDIYDRAPQGSGRTFVDLAVGCVLHGIIYGVIGLIVAEHKAGFLAGIGIGTAASILMAASMMLSIESCVDMPPGKAERSMVVGSILRMAFMLFVAWCGIRFSAISFPGVIIGLIGLKVSAYLHIYINVYITRRLFKRKNPPEGEIDGRL